MKRQNQASEPHIKKAASIIDQGELVIFPTETVYGLGADAGNDAACKKIYSTKGRPSNNPLIVHCANIETISSFAQIETWVALIMHKLWPGPISIVMEYIPKGNIAPTVLAGLNSVCVRIPNDATALRLIAATKTQMIAAPSANISNYVSPTRFEHVKLEFPHIFALDGGNCAHGIESTILDGRGSLSQISQENIQKRILRQGFISAQKIFESINQSSLGMNNTTNLSNAKSQNYILENSNDHEHTLLAPGMLLKHYSPHTKLVINVGINANISQHNNDDSEDKNAQFDFDRVHISFGSNSFPAAKHVMNLSESGNLIEAAYHLYDFLRCADNISKAHQYNLITVSPIPNNGVGVAINDKLHKAQN